MYRATLIVGTVWICCSVVYLLHPATGPFDYAAGEFKADWTGGLIGGLVGGVVAGVIVRRLMRKVRDNAAARGGGPEAVKQELAAVYANSLVISLSTCAGWGLMLHVGATPLAMAVGVPHQVWLRFAPGAFLFGLIVGAVLYATRKRRAVA